MSKLFVTLAIIPAAASTAFGTVVHTLVEDWTATSAVLSGFTTKAYETTAPPAPSHTFVDVAATHGATGQWIYAASDAGSVFTATFSLTGVAAFDTVSIDRLLLGGGGGIDPEHGDGLTITVNGTNLASVLLGGRAGRPAASYGESAPIAAILQGLATDNTNGSEFIDKRTDGWGHDSLFDLGQDPAFDDVAISGSGDVTIVITGNLTNGVGGSEGGVDEQMVIGNLGLSFNAIPEPSSAILALLAAVIPLVSRRR